MNDTLFHNGTILTLHGGSEKAETAEAIAVKDGKIKACGTYKEVRQAVSEKCEFVDLKGKTLMPGFNDSHTHLIDAGESLYSPDLDNLDEKEITDVLFEHEKKIPDGYPLICRGWDYANIPAPTKETLDYSFPHRPVFLFHKSGHAAWFNRRAFDSFGLGRWLGVNENLWKVPLNQNGEPVGTIDEPYECPAVKKILTKLQRNETRILQALRAILPAYAEKGITSVQDNTWDPDLYRIYRKEINTLSMTCWADGSNETSLPRMLELEAAASRAVDQAGGAESQAAAVDRAGTSYGVGRGAHRRGERAFYDGEKYFQPGEAAPANFAVGPVKFFLDGAFGSRTAWLWEPYKNDGDNCGTGLPAAEIVRRIEPYVAQKRQLAFHAIGDRAISELLDALDLLLPLYPWIPELRIRIEHAQLIREDDFPRLIRHGIVVSAQPAASGDFLRDLTLVGEKRAIRAYPHRSLLEWEIPLAMGSDFPFDSSFDPLESLAIIAKRPSPERIDPLDLLTAYTKGSAYAEFSENSKGTLSPGNEADFIILNRNPLYFGAFQDGIEVVSTYHRGMRVFQRSALQMAA